MIAWLSFALFPLFALYIYRRHEAALASCITVLVGSLFLPEQFLISFPFLPDLDKERITYLSALLGILIFARRRFFACRPGLGIEAIFLFVIVARVGTLWINSEAVFNEGELRQGIGLYWLASYMVDDLLIYVIPFLVGRTMIRNESDLKILMTSLVAAGCAYTVLIFTEVLLSIPFHVWQLSQVLYGIPIRPMWRWGIIQPVVFMDNGLAVASYMAVATVSAAALRISRVPLSRPVPRYAWSTVLLGLTLTWNVAGILYGWSLSVAHRLFSRANLRRLASLLVIVVCLYPALRIFDFFPSESLVSIAAQLDETRARSLEGRFLEEEFVLGNVGERFWFGWAMFDRIPGAASFGRGESGLDSWWIIRFGLTGLVGVELLMLMLAWPVLRAAKSIKRSSCWIHPGLVVGLMLCVGLRMADLLLNGWFNSLPAFLAGCLAGVTHTRISVRANTPGWDEQESK